MKYLFSRKYNTFDVVMAIILGITAANKVPIVYILPFFAIMAVISALGEMHYKDNL